MTLQPPQKALTSHTDVFTFKWRGNEIDLCTSYSNIARLEKNMGMSFEQAILVNKSLQKHTEVFYYLQEGTNYTPDQIRAAFFPNLNVLSDEEWATQVELCAHYLMGLSELEILNDLSPSSDKKNTSQAD